MNADSPRSSRREGALLLADISGYTRFLQGVADAHRDLIVEADEPPAAYAVLSHLLDTMVVAIAPSFRLAKLEGDAIFAISGNGAADGQAVIDVVERCHAAFRGELSRAGSQWICSCAACAVVGELDVKFVVHHGAYVAQSIAGNEEFLGPDVNLAHRLLKNHARELVGTVPYALFTEAAVQALAVPTDRMVAGQEAYDDRPPVGVHVLPLAAAA
ncbi:hypothetical protein BH24CHL7_BH24CHL7_15290 [soil metagenome]